CLVQPITIYNISHNNKTWYFFKAWIGALLIVFLLSLSTYANSIVFNDDFENDWINGWSVDMEGVWEIGTPVYTNGPAIAYEGNNVAGTVLSDDYPQETDSRLISPALELPTINNNERMELRFWQWYHYRTNDEGAVQISVWDDNSWSSWETIAQPISVFNVKNSWSRIGIDLTLYQGQRIRIAFFHTANASHQRAGWYIDNVEIWKGVPTLAPVETFESGWGDWTTDFGLWQIGLPDYKNGPDTAYEGNSVAGTVLSDDYPQETDSRLISPAIELPILNSNERIELRFWQWYHYYKNDDGLIQISILEESNWSSWETIVQPISVFNIEASWSRIGVDLTPYQGQRIRLAFFHSANNVHQRAGWYIDNVEIWKGAPTLFQIETFESGWGDWTTDFGLWQFGVPTSGPISALEGNSVAGTVLNDDYLPQVNSRLISPAMDLPIVDSTERIELRFWQWFDYRSGDEGLVQISIWEDGIWSLWETIVQSTAIPLSILI
ncbi:choice-of-anchor J domain-containing protein, partial [Planctomycetota bacterium]